MSFGKKLKRLREEQGLSIRELSEEIGIPTSTLGSYEQTGTGARRPKKNNLKKIADFFGVTTDYFGIATEHSSEHEKNYVRVAREDITDIAFMAESIRQVVTLIELGDEDSINELLSEAMELIGMLERVLEVDKVLVDEVLNAVEEANTKGKKAKIYNMLGERVDD